MLSGENERGVGVRRDVVKIRFLFYLLPRPCKQFLKRHLKQPTVALTYF